MPYSHMAEHVRSKGRGDDTMLVHMTPHEVGGLQALAMAHGGSLTINPETGLPEAGWLGKLLPTILGAVGMAFGIPPIWTGVLGAVGGTAITGNLKEGLMAGLGAFGGASMAGAAGIGSSLGNVGAGLGLPGSVAKAIPGALTGGAGNAASVAGSAIRNAAGAASNIGSTASTIGSTVGNVGSAVGTAAANAAGKTGLAGLAQGFGDSAKMGLGTGILSKAAVPLAVMGSTQALGAFSPTPKQGEKPVDEYGYTGPYTVQREVLNPYDKSRAPFDPTNFDSSAKRYFGPISYADSAGKPYIPGMKTTPTAANASSSMARPMGVMLPPPVMNQNINPGQLTPEQLAMLQQYGAPQGYADGGQVGDSTFTFPSQMSEQQMQMMPQPSSQLVQQDQQPQYQQPSPYMQPSSYGQLSSYGQPQHGNNPNGLGQINNLPGLARGGEVPLKQGSFVVDARTVSELGNGSSGAGQDLLARLGGMAIRGPGDGVSDSIRANIGGMQQARVARDEVQFSPEAVQRLGKGSHSRGTQKLYTLMNKAQTARKNAKRGQDTGLRRGVA